MASTQQGSPGPASAHDTDQPNMNSMYDVEWVKKLLEQIKSFLRQNSAWLGIDPSRPQRICDYACGNGTVSIALLDSFPQATFHGIDVLDSQVKLFNSEAQKALGLDYEKRLSAIQGDFNEPEKTPVLSTPQWAGFDAIIISFALHHVDDPIDFLKLLKARVKPGGTVVVVDWLKEAEDVQRKEGEPKYNPADMKAVPMGKVWPGFSVEDVHEDYDASGLKDVDVRLYGEKVELPQQANFGGKSTMYISKATAP